ncbi:hypothetical protein Tsubulata_050403 [Turnera subulata]|uniref:NB-ARC domain-containing protein n=1 Tax=Turnera subulata TaxID=218843 RepID=A0A9Q0FDK9_9ROSI|nr:hypothetical protein Tsubulata_050403 [Turnera subulata]
MELSWVPSLVKLKALKKLDLHMTAIEEFPEGMECLCNLKYLDLSNTRLKAFPTRILPKLCHLQCLGISVPAGGQEVASLRKLETLLCNFSYFEDEE